MNNDKQQNKMRRHRRVRAKLSGTPDVPRLNVSRSLRFIFVQLIDDTSGKTIASANSKVDVKAGEAGERKGKVASAYLLGLVLAKRAQAAGIVKVVFDRGGYKYHGRVKAVADGARDGGLQF